MTMKNGDEYSGQFHDDLFEGYSLYKFANGDVYTGDFHKGIMEGEGLLKIERDGRDYAGKFKDGKLMYGELKCNEGTFLG